MFLFTEAGFWSSAKSCKRKLHSYSLAPLLLSNPLLQWSRSKALSQRHLFCQIFRGGAEGAKSSTPPAHSRSRAPLLLTAHPPWPQDRSWTGRQHNILLAGKPFACLPPWNPKGRRPCQKLKTRLCSIMLCKPPRAALCKYRPPVQLPTQVHTWYGEQKSQFCILDRDTRTPFPTCYRYAVQCWDNKA